MEAHCGSRIRSITRADPQDPDHEPNYHCSGLPIAGMVVSQIFRQHCLQQQNFCFIIIQLGGRVG